MKIELDLPDEKYGSFFDYIKTYFDIKEKEYCEFIVKTEIESRMKDLGFNFSKNT